MYTHVKCGVEAGKLWICKIMAHIGLGLLGLHVNATTSTPIIIHANIRATLSTKTLRYSMRIAILWSVMAAM